MKNLKFSAKTHATSRRGRLETIAVCALGAWAATAALAANQAEATPATGGARKAFVYQNPIVSEVIDGGIQRAGGQEPKPSVASKVPRFTFAESLEEQERQLRTNPLLQRFQASRQKLAADPHRPIYHYVNPEGELNDPNGLCLWKGRWHLFYQAYPPEDPRQHWGHAVSDDLVHWRDLPLAIYPSPEDKVYSGTTLVEDNRVIAIYHGVGTGTMVAVSDDPLLLNWSKVTGNAVIPLPKKGDPPLPYNVFDPVIWKQGAHYYALTAGRQRIPGNKTVRAEFLHRSKDLAKWEYLHPFLENDYWGLVGDDGACPYFWPLGSKHILLHFSHMSGGKYMLGDYDTKRDRFIVTGGGMFNFGPCGPSGVHAPSAAPDGKGGIIAIFNMNPGKPTKGWNQIMTLPRRLTLAGTDDLGIEPVAALESLRRSHVRVGPTALPANQEIVLPNVSGNAIEIKAEFQPSAASVLELNVLRSPGREEVTRIQFYRNRGFFNRQNRKQASALSIDTSYSSTLPDVQARIPETASFFVADGEPLKLRVFVDRSVVEVFANDRQCAAVRVYPGRPDSVGVSLRSQGLATVLSSLDAWQMADIYR
jgi:beta-fructofuranosidase